MMLSLQTITVCVVVCCHMPAICWADSAAWGAWSSWTCSVTCGRGRESRTRTCTPGARCAGDASQTQECQRPACCVARHGQWNTWGSWSSCSPSCGQGTQTRSRTCDGPNNCGQPCQGDLSQSRACNVEECPRAPGVPTIITDPPTSPFSVGVTVTLTCSSLDLGSPPATLTWVTWRQGVRTTPVNERTTRLEMFNLSVEDDGLSVKCQANNSLSHKETSFVLRVDQKASYGECHASVSSSTWQVTGYCDITNVFSSDDRYDCNWYEYGRSIQYRSNIRSSFNRSLITPGRKLLRGRCGFHTTIPRDFLERREVSRELKYQMFFNPGGTWRPVINVTVASPKAPTLTCPADVTEGSHMNCTCSTSDVGEPGGRLLLFSNDRLEDTGQYGQKVIFLSRDVRREDNNVRVSCRLHWARNVSADRDWTLRVLYVPEMPSLRVNTLKIANFTTKNNTRADLSCEAGAGKIQRLELLKLTRNGTQLLQSSEASSLVKIQTAKCADSGIYYCRAGNTLGQTNSTSVKLNVLCSPELVNGTSATSNHLKVTEGSNGQLTFEVIGYPAPAIVGVSYHLKENMSSSNEEPARADLFTGECEQNTPDVHLATCTLSIADATYTDNGMYNVHLSNSQGTIHVPVELIVDISSVWGEWGTWSACSATCGDGTRSRSRTCSPEQGACPGEATETDTCNITACCVPKNGQWSDWSSWSPCSQTCGKGLRSKSRTCSEPNACGRPCEGNNFVDEPCNLQAGSVADDGLSVKCQANNSVSHNEKSFVRGVDRPAPNQASSAKKPCKCTCTCSSTCSLP